MGKSDPRFLIKKTCQNWSNFKKNNYEIVIIRNINVKLYILSNRGCINFLMRSPKTFCTVVTPWLYKKSFEFFIFTPRLPTYNTDSDTFHFFDVSPQWTRTENLNWKFFRYIFGNLFGILMGPYIFRMIPFYCWQSCT